MRSDLGHGEEVETQEELKKVKDGCHIKTEPQLEFF